MARPSMATLPADGATKPAIRFSSVVLPQPEAPMTTLKLPSCKSREISRNTSTAQPAASNVTPTLCKRIIAPP